MAKSAARAQADQVAAALTGGRDPAGSLSGSSQDSLDWTRPGIDGIVANATPANGEGAVVLMHDGGGDRSQTVAALDRLIPQLQARGYRFATVTDAVGLPPANTPADPADRAAGTALVGLVRSATVAVQVAAYVLLAVGVVVAARLLLVAAVARRHARRPDPPPPPPELGVSVVVPAFNEEANMQRRCDRCSRADIPSRWWWSTTAPRTARPRSSAP